MQDKPQDDAMIHSTRACCTPSHSTFSAQGGIRQQEDSSSLGGQQSEGAILLAGGIFLMGTNYEEAFAADGEGPVRPVEVSPFRIEKFPVTNERYLRFVQEAGYRTEAERFGWSFVFWSSIPKKRFAHVVEDTVQAAPWWCKVPGATFRTPEGPGSDVRGRMNILWCT